MFRKRTDRGSLNLEQALIVALLVLAAAGTLLVMGQSIACAYAKETVAAGGEVPEPWATSCGLASVSENRLTVLWDTQAGTYPPPDPGPYGLVSAATGEVVTTTVWRNITGPEDLYPQASFAADTWATRTPEWQAAVSAGIYILDFGQVPNGDYLIIRPSAPLVANIFITVQDIPEGTVQGYPEYYYNGYQADEYAFSEMSILFSAWQ